MSGGQLSAGQETLGAFGTGNFLHTGGTNTVAGTLILGSLSGSGGAYTLSESAQLFAEGERIGNYGTGTFQQSGGTNTITDNGDLYVGTYSSATYTLTGGTVKTPNHVYIGFGDDSQGVMTQNETVAHSVVNIDGTLFIGFSVAIGTYNLNAGELSVDAMYAGNGGTGTFAQSGGTCTVDNNLTIAETDGSDGELEISGGTITVRGELLVGGGTNSTGTATLDVQDDTSSITVGGKLQFEACSELTITGDEYPLITLAARGKSRAA